MFTSSNVICRCLIYRSIKDFVLSLTPDNKVSNIRWCYDKEVSKVDYFYLTEI